MKHFAQEEWADFARGLASADRRAAMQKHLAEGCKKCAKTAGLWRQVARTGASEGRYEPPPATVRCAKAQFDFQKPQPSASPWMPTLIWDSLLHPAQAGLRTAAAESRRDTPRQILYGAGSLRIDLTLQPQVGSNKWVLIGQVLDTGQPLRSVSEVIAIIQDGREQVCRALTNRFGEFRLEFDPTKELTLSVIPQPGNEVRIPLHAFGTQGDTDA